MISLIYGKRGSGKTTLAKSLIRDETRVVIFDTLDEYEGCCKDVVETPIGLCDLLEVYEQDNFKIRYLGDENDFDNVCKILYTQNNIVLLVDELDMYTGFNFTPLHLKYLVRYGRHYNLSLIGISRRPAEIPKLVTSQADRIYSYLQFEPRDILYLKSFIPEADRISSLQEYQHLCYDTRDGKIIFNKIQDLS